MPAPSPSIASLVAALTLTLAPAAGAADLWLVDAAGFGDFTDLQTAVDVAQDGDVLLVRAGVYDGFTIVHEGLTVVANEPGSVIVVGGVRVENTLEHHAVVLAGLDLRGRNDVVAFTADQAPALGLSVCRGPVRVERCTLRGVDGQFIQCHPSFLQCCTCNGTDAMHAELALDVSLHDCLLVGGEGTGWFEGHAKNRGGDALRVLGGSVSLFDCELRGAGGGTSDSIDNLFQGGDGGHALLAEEHALSPEVRVWVSGGELVGGDGRIGDPCLEPCGNGGDGVRADGASVRVRLQDVVPVPGADGCPQCGFPANGLPGIAENELSGARIVHRAGALRDLETPLLGTSGATLPVTYRGEAGDLVWVQSGTVTSQSPAPAWTGVRLLAGGQPAHLQFLGQAGPGGDLSVPLSLLQPPSNELPGPLFLQVVARDSSGRGWFGAGCAVLLQD